MLYAQSIVHPILAAPTIRRIFDLPKYRHLRDWQTECHRSQSEILDFLVLRRLATSAIWKQSRKNSSKDKLKLFIIQRLLLALLLPLPISNVWKEAKNVRPTLSRYAEYPWTSGTQSTNFCKHEMPRNYCAIRSEERR